MVLKTRSVWYSNSVCRNEKDQVEFFPVGLTFSESSEFGSPSILVLLTILLPIHHNNRLPYTDNATIVLYWHWNLILSPLKNRIFFSLFVLMVQNVEQPYDTAS